MFDFMIEHPAVTPELHVIDKLIVISAYYDYLRLPIVSITFLKHNNVASQSHGCFCLRREMWEPVCKMTDLIFCRVVKIIRILVDSHKTSLIRYGVCNRFETRG